MTSAGARSTSRPTGDPARMKDGTISGSSMTAETQFGGIPFEIDLAYQTRERAGQPGGTPIGRWTSMTRMVHVPSVATSWSA